MAGEARKTIMAGSVVVKVKPDLSAFRGAKVSDIAAVLEDEGVNWPGSLHVAYRLTQEFSVFPK